MRTLIYFPDSLNTKRKSSKFLTFYFFFTFSFLKHIYKTISMRKRVKISLHENFLFFLIFFNIFCSLFSRSAIGFPTQWRHAALVGRQAYRLRLRPGRRPRRSRDACTASDVILYTALKASPNYIKLTYSTDSFFFYWFFFPHLLRVSTSILTFNTKDENKTASENVRVGTNYFSSVVFFLFIWEQTMLPI